MPTKRVKHVSDFVKHIEKNNQGYLYPPFFLYRGENKANYKLIPSLYREGTQTGITVNLFLESSTERGILHEFIGEAASYINHLNTDDRFTWMEYAQHFGVPTRLLDWSANPLVALFFACQPSNEEDGKLYILNCDFYRQILSEDNYKNVNGKTIKEAALNMIWEDQKGFLYPATFKPYYIDKRMSAQSSHFMIWGDCQQPLDKMIQRLELTKKGTALRFYKIEKGEQTQSSFSDTALHHLIIPAESKLRILRELDQLGINNATLFPGLDGIGKTIAWQCNFFNRDLDNAPF